MTQIVKPEILDSSAFQRPLENVLNGKRFWRSAPRGEYEIGVDTSQLGALTQQIQAWPVSGSTRLSPFFVSFNRITPRFGSTWFQRSERISVRRAPVDMAKTTMT